MKKVLKYIGLTLVVVIIAAVWLNFPKLSIMSGYTAKMMCSCKYVAGRSPESVKAVDLDFFPIKYANYEIDSVNKSVTANVFGFQSQTAYYNPKTGCALASEKAKDNYQATTFNTKNTYQAVDSLYWPYSNTLPDTLPSSIDMAKLKTAFANHFKEDSLETVNGVKRNTRAILMLYKGQIVMEQYADGFDKDSRLIGWSMTKSIVNAMIGVLVKQGKININDPMPIKEWQNDERKNITWDNMLKMSDGLDWEEEYAYISDATKMLYKSDDMYAYAIQTPLKNKPGEVFYYSSGTSNILAGALKQVIGDDYLSFPYDEIFSQIGMNSMLMETDASGKFVGSSYSWATARDWAKFGLLYANKGEWNGKQILSKDWVDYTSQTIPQSDDNYGAHFWTQDSVKEAGAPNDMYGAKGFQDQKVFIFPSQDIVLVRLGSTHGRTNMSPLILDILEATGTNL